MMHRMEPAGVRPLPASGLSRRALVKRHGIGAAGAVLALARVPVPVVGAAGAPVSDGEALAWLLSLEHQLVDFYDRSLAEFDALAFEEAGYEPLLHGWLAGFADQERLHAERLAWMVADAQGPEPEVWPADALLPWTPTDVIAMAESAENAIRHAYASAAVTIENPRFLGDIIGIMSVEARHAGFLAGFADWPDPAPEAVDAAEPLQPDGMVSLDQSVAFYGPEESEATPVDIATGPQFPDHLPTMPPQLAPAASPPAGTAVPDH